MGYRAVRNVVIVPFGECALESRRMDGWLRFRSCHLPARIYLGAELEGDCLSVCVTLYIFIKPLCYFCGEVKLAFGVIFHVSRYTRCAII